jgi:hypothetical protein
MNGLNRTVWTIPALLLIIGASLSASADGNPFIGNWKLNSSKSRMPDEMKVESKGDNKYSFNFGSGEETLVVDGTDQPGVDGTTLSVKVEAPDTWIVERKKDGQRLITATWKLSKDGSTLTDLFRQYGPNGPTMSMDYVYQRTGGGTGFAADWQSIKETMNSPYVLQVKTYESEGLSLMFNNPSAQTTKTLMLDGKEYPQTSNASPGSTSSSRRVDEHMIEWTNKDGGKVTGTREINLSSDGKTLTLTSRAPGQSKPTIMVFDRQ